MIHGLLVTGGEAPPRSRLAFRFGEFGLVCAADSGLDTAAAWGLVPQIIVGDMDSIADPALIAAYPKARVFRASPDKDQSDTELALAALSEAGAGRIVLAGGGGGRLDHLLAIRSLFEGGLYPAEWHTAHEALYLVEEGSRFEGRARAGGLVSVFPLAAGALGMRSGGLKWPLKGLVWGARDCGLSNVAPDGEFWIEAGTGRLLVVIAESP